MITAAAITSGASLARSRPSTRPKVELTRVLILLLAALVQFDGFQDLPTIAGKTVFAMAGYAVMLTALPRTRLILASLDRPFHLVVFAWAMGTLLALAMAVDGSRPLDHELFTSWQMLALYALVTYSVARPGQWIGATKLLVLSSMASFALYVALYLLRVGVVEIEAQYRVRTVYGYEANHVGHACALFAILVVSTLGIWKRRTRYLVAAVGALITLAVTVMSNSRGAILTLLVGLSAFLYLARKRGVRRTGRGAVLVAGLACLGYLLLATESWERIASRMPGEGASLNLSELTTGRTDILSAGLEIAATTPFGLGIGNAKYEIGPRVAMFNMTRLNAQNEYLRVTMECGWVGGLAFVVAFLVLLKRAYAAFRREGEVWPLVILITLMTSYMSLSTTFDKVTWVLLGLVSGALKASEWAAAAAPPKPQVGFAASSRRA